MGVRSLLNSSGTYSGMRYRARFFLRTFLVRSLSRIFHDKCLRERARFRCFFHFMSFQRTTQSARHAALLDEPSSSSAQLCLNAIHFLARLNRIPSLTLACTNSSYTTTSPACGTAAKNPTLASHPELNSRPASAPWNDAISRSKSSA